MGGLARLLAFLLANAQGILAIIALIIRLLQPPDAVMEASQRAVVDVDLVKTWCDTQVTDD